LLYLHVSRFLFLFASCLVLQKTLSQRERVINRHMLQSSPFLFPIFVPLVSPQQPPQMPLFYPPPYHNVSPFIFPSPQYRFVYPKTKQHMPVQQKQTAKKSDSYRIMSYNIMRDDLHENHYLETWKWRHREHKILRTIQDANPDILCLQECRDLQGHPIAQFLKQLLPLGYDYESHCDFNNPRLRVVTAFKRNLFQLSMHRTFWLNRDNLESPLMVTNEAKQMHKTMRPIGFDILIPIFVKSSNTKLHPIHVYNTHLGHSIAEKEWSVQILPELMRQYSGLISPAVLCMDANFFSQHSGLQQRQTLCSARSYQLLDLTAHARLVLETDEKTVAKIHSPTGTFIGTSIDFNKPKLGELGNALDIIAGHNVNLQSALLWNKTFLNPEPRFLENYDIFPSDHVAILITISISS